MSQCSKPAKEDYDPNLTYSDRHGPQYLYDSPPQELEDAVSTNLGDLSYYTKGQIVYNNKNEPVVFNGASLSGTEYNTNPLSIGTSFSQMQSYVKDWKMNVIRIPINPDFYMKASQGEIDIYKQFLDTIIIRAFSAGFQLVILDIHRPGGGFQFDENHYNTFYNLLYKYGYIPVIAFEPLNEYPAYFGPDDINKWWVGNREDPSTNYGVKSMLDLARGDKSSATYTTNLIIIGGVDFSYQLSFLNPTVAKTNPKQNFDINTVLNYQSPNPVNIIFNSHPYGYKGVPKSMGTATDPIPEDLIITGTTSGREKYQYLKDKNIMDPSTYMDECGWTDSFLWILNGKYAPLIFTEFGLSDPEKCIEGGFYFAGLCQLEKMQNSISKGSMHMCAWALVFEGLDYPSLLTGNCQGTYPTGKAKVSVEGPAVSATENDNYKGPGDYWKNFLNGSMMTVSPPPPTTKKTSSKYSKIIRISCNH